ncbi:MAG: response regulator [Candidatus Paceibacterota bacterium]
MTENNEEKKGIKILLVDDDSFLLDMYSLKFKKAGVDVSAVSSSINALDKLRAGEKYDVILLDIIMPGMDGMELLENIRKEKLCPEATIIMLTNQPDEVDRAKELGVSGYIVKATTIPSEVVEQVLEIYQNNKNK